MAILDSSGKPIPKVTKPKAGHDLVECNFLVSNLSEVDNNPMTVMSQRGPMPVALEQVLGQIAKNLYGVLSHLKQTQVIFSIEDKSSPTILEKQLEINVLQIQKPETTESDEGKRTDVD